MKRILALILTLCITAALFAGCAGNGAPSSATDPKNTDHTTDPAAQGDSATKPQQETTPADTAAPTEAESKDDTTPIEITFPAVLFTNVDMTTFDADSYAKDNGFLGAVVNSDGSVTVTVSKDQYEEILQETAKSLDETFSKLIEAEDTPYIKDITHSDDFRTVEVNVIRADYESTFDLTPFVIGISVMTYQAFLGIDPHVEISVVDVDTGDTIHSTVYPDALENAE